MTTINRTTPWKATGDTTVDALRAEFATQPGSPLAAHAEAILQASSPYSRLLAAMSWVEKKHETWPFSPIPAGFHNFLSITAGWDSVNNVHLWRQFSSYAACATFWKGLLEAPGGPYPQLGSISDLIYVYAPPFDSNQTEPYIADVVTIVNRLPSPEIAVEFVPYDDVRIFTVRSNAIATPRRGPTRTAPLVPEAFVAPNGEIPGDGFFRGEVIAGTNRWLRTAGPDHLAVHASAFVEPL